MDDLVTCAEARCSGTGAALLTELEHRGKAADRERVELDSGTANQAAHRSYHRHRTGAIALPSAKLVGTS